MEGFLAAFLWKLVEWALLGETVDGQRELAISNGDALTLFQLVIMIKFYRVWRKSLRPVEARLKNIENRQDHTFERMNDIRTEVRRQRQG